MGKSTINGSCSIAMLAITRGYLNPTLTPPSLWTLRMRCSRSQAFIRKRPGCYGTGCSWGTTQAAPVSRGCLGLVNIWEICQNHLRQSDILGRSCFLFMYRPRIICDCWICLTQNGRGLGFSMLLIYQSNIKTPNEIE